MKSFLILIFTLFQATASQASIYASPSYVNFGSVRTGFGSMRTVTVYNNNDTDVSIRYSTCFGDIGARTYSCTSIRKNGSCTIQISYRPRREGSDSCRLTVSAVNNGSGYATISISGRAYDPDRFDPLDFDPAEQLMLKQFAEESR